MKNRSRLTHGYSLIELLLVLVIIGILSTGAVAMIGNRKSSSVMALMDQVEGTIMHAQKLAHATGQDIALAVNGTWRAAGAPSLANNGAFIMDPRRFVEPGTRSNPFTRERLGSTTDVLVSLHNSNVREHRYACIATDAASNALADSLAQVKPFSTDDLFLSALRNRLTGNGQKVVFVNGVNSRFEEGFSVVMSELNDDGMANVGGGVGVIVVPRNSANVYRFFKRSGEDTWLRR